MDLKYLEDTFKRVKDFYSIEDEIDLIPDFKIKFRVFRSEGFSKAVSDFQEGLISYSDFLYTVFSLFVIKINNVDVEDIELSSTTESLSDYLEKLARKNLDINILNAFFLVVREHLNNLDEKAQNTVKNDLLKSVLETASNAYEQLDLKVKEATEGSVASDKNIPKSS